MRFAFPSNFTGHPAISFPAGYDSNGLPVGTAGDRPAVGRAHAAPHCGGGRIDRRTQERRAAGIRCWTADVVTVGLVLALVIGLTLGLVRRRRIDPHRARLRVRARLRSEARDRDELSDRRHHESRRRDRALARRERAALERAAVRPRRDDRRVRRRARVVAARRRTQLAFSASSMAAAAVMMLRSGARERRDGRRAHGAPSPALYLVALARRRCSPASSASAADF